MATDLSTANVTDTKSGTGWTIDVTAANLLADLSIKDFIMLIEGTLEPNSNITKTSRTVLTYNGASIASSTVEVRRVTPQNRFQETTFAEKFSSTIYNEEIDRLIRKSYEYTLNGIGPGSTATIQTPLDDAYSAAWNGDTIRPATRNALYDKIETLATLSEDEAITGNWTAPTQTDGNNSTRLATTAYVETHVTNELAGSPALGGNPTAATQAAANNSTRIATTAHVKDHLAASPALGGTPTAPTAANATDTTQIATTAHVKNYLEDVPITSTATVNNNSTRIASTQFATQMINPVAIAESRTSTALTAVDNTVIYLSDHLDTNNVYNTSTGVFTVPSAGIYQINAACNISQTTGSTNLYGLEVFVEGTLSRTIAEYLLPTGQGVVLCGSCLLNLNANDEVTISVRNDSSPSSITLGASGGRTDLSWASLQKLGNSVSLS